MTVNEKAIEKVLSSPRLLHLVLNNEPIGEKMWGLDELTLAQVLHIQEIYKRNKKLLEPFLPKEPDRYKTSLIEKINLIEEIYEQNLFVSIDPPNETTRVLDFIENFKMSIKDKNNDKFEAHLKISTEKSYDIILEVELRIYKKDNYYCVNFNHTSMGSYENGENAITNQIIRLMELNFSELSKKMIDNYFKSLVQSEKIEETLNLIGNFVKECYYSANAEISENLLNKINSELDQIEDPLAKKILVETIKDFDSNLESLKDLFNPKISLTDKLLKNRFTQHFQFCVVPGQPQKRSIIILQGVFFNTQILEMVGFFSRNGLSGSFIICIGHHFDPLTKFLIKTRNISGYIQNTGTHHSSSAYENLRKSNLSEEDITFVTSLPYNQEGDDAEWIYRSDKFLKGLKNVNIVF